MKIIVTDQDGKVHEIEAIDGWRVMEIIRDHGLPIKAECGGCASCATCHVYVDEDWLSKLYPMRDDEQDLLDTAPDVQDNSRLSCQILMSEELDGLRVTLAPGTEP
jgi:ferredoxin, 2Fe-2S